MSKSKKSLREIDAFSIMGQQTSTPSTTDIDADLFGAIGVMDANRHIANPVSIFDIYPDLRQPRRVVPSVLRHLWQGDPRQTESLFTGWLEAIEAERGSKFDLAPYLAEEAEIDHADDIGPLEDAFLKLLELASSIHRDGLTNPITVAPRGLKYSLETGERRWLAYHLLYLQTREERYAQIAARTVDSVNLWRQAAENNARANLNAIGKARQFAVLLMDLLKDTSFLPLPSFAVERGYYAQVADGERFRVPRNASQRLLVAMGLKNPKQLREYRRLLDLPDVVWQLADDLNWTEYAIRAMREEARDDEHLIQLALKRAKQEGYSVPTGAVSPEEPSVPAPIERVLEDVVPGSKQYYSHVLKAIQKAAPGKRAVNQQALQMIADMRRWLEEQEAKIEKFL
mgnify:CR=1 FL=1